MVIHAMPSLYTLTVQDTRLTGPNPSSWHMRRTGKEERSEKQSRSRGLQIPSTQTLEFISTPHGSLSILFHQTTPPKPMNTPTFQATMMFKDFSGSDLTDRQA